MGSEHAAGFLIIALFGVLISADAVYRYRHPSDWWRRGIWRRFPGWLWANPHYVIRRMRPRRSVRDERLDAAFSLLVGLLVIALGAAVGVHVL
jgi:hypothetical protein